ncbi:transcription elongation factor GreB [Pseudenhygromyxa sp. WMMC2535]|uniref:transcription elongation factor GreB n=1 Tax=Pseudenhygromyxa sp. WMMC2535 TaxID=2712867 RepID=UPI0015564C6D|nr:transcription elongation factor GreB [Pseudenhygromyxa sp. WMMC2535]NVB36954.1 transcription elongation factor GreB [Pseudenhygromyxa sp. WMMC2535]
MAALDKLITPIGHAKLQAELEQLWKVERPRVTDEVAAAAALGDRSENAEYQYGKRRLREIDRRVRWLNKRLGELKVVRTAPSDGRVHFGMWVTVEDEAGERKRWQLVGGDEFDVDAGKISVNSPIGKALLGKEVGDDVEIRRPRGDLELVIVAVEQPSYPEGEG